MIDPSTQKIVDALTPAIEETIKQWQEDMTGSIKDKLLESLEPYQFHDTAVHIFPQEDEHDAMKLLVAFKTGEDQDFVVIPVMVTLDD